MSEIVQAFRRQKFIHVACQNVSSFVIIWQSYRRRQTVPLI